MSITDPSEPGVSARHAKPKPPVVGIGASAGGLKALRSFFSHVPDDSGLAFVVVVHLSPDRESHLPDLLQPHVKVPVQQVTETTPLRPDHVYVIPPGMNISAIDTHLRLSSLEERRAERAPIDHFFRTLARTHDGHAIGVILTGTGSDGSLGLKEIKEQGGLTIAQDPNEAEFDGMPQSAISTGMVDLVLPLEEIPDSITRFIRTNPRIEVPEQGEEIADDARQLLHRVFTQVRARTGRDFTRYKRSTILRRIARRMQLNHVEDLAVYMTLLREHPEEVRALADDLLVTVTSFFREPEVYQKLKEQVLPALFSTKQAEDDVRVWSVGCATGEEAYSLAMLLLEEATSHEAPPRIQLLASDLHEHSLHRAREGYYPGDIAVDVGLERLRRFFVKENEGWRVRKELRELVVFAPHNLLGDPPFSRMDMISCRNVLIYLQRDAQRDVIELFHYALRPDGYLLLGSSESFEGSDLFVPVDKKCCVWRKRNVPAPEPRLPVFPLSRTRLPGGSERPARPGEPIAYGSLHQRMLEQVGPPSMLLSPDDKAVHLSGSVGRYLVHPGGEITANVLKLVREELRIELRATLASAREQKAPARSNPVIMQFGGETRRVVIDVRPSPDPQHDGFTLVLLEESVAEGAPAASPPTNTDSGRRVREMEEELDRTRQRLQALIEEYETSQEEMRASNEELQSTNEELRSTMEELETSKEELQSMNEELQTVNQENRHKVEELALLSSDLQNLLGASDIATLFLDRDLRIMRFTPKLGELFNVRSSDRGRPISDITHRLGYPELLEDAEAVLAHLVPVGREVQDEQQHWYLTRVLPYRSVEDQIQGVVITFVDITERKRVEESLKQSDLRKEEFLAILAHELRNPLAALNNGMALLAMAGSDMQLLDKTRQMMQRQLQQLVRLVDDLLDVSRISRGKLTLHKVRTELSAVLEHAVETSQVRANGRRIELDLPAESIQLEADPVRLAQVFSNLINACNFTRPGGRIVVGAEPIDGTVLISVTDDGVGIAAEKLKGLFEMFHQGGSSMEPSPEGLGIGLALVKRLVELHGGSVLASSKGVDQGATFAVRLPVTAPLRESARPMREPAPKVAGLRILVVDDNQDVARSLALLLQVGGNTVSTAHDGEQAVRAAQTFRPDVVLMDLGMPGLDGYEAVRQIRQQAGGRDITIIAVTGWAQSLDRQRSAAAGFDSHVIKPVDPAVLERLLAELRAAKLKDQADE